MAIQWYPGHMNTARREAEKKMEAIDVVIEMVDARLPEASSNPLIKELRLHRQRPCLKILNKADLADPAVTTAWLKFYNQESGVQAVALSCKKPGQAAKVPQLCQLLAPHRNSSIKPLRMLIMGIPNVGKSTFMNLLLKRRFAKVGDEPAVTRIQQRHNLNNQMTLIDSPGLLWPKIENPMVGMKLAVIYAVTAKIIVEEEIAEFLATILLEWYPDLLEKRYGCHGNNLDERGLLEVIAKKRGCLVKGKGGGLDCEKAAKILLNDFRNGMLGRTSLEAPDIYDFLA